MKSMNKREGKKVAVMAVVIMSLMMVAFMPLVSAEVTSFTVMPSTGIVGAVDSYDVFVITSGVTSINITIPAGFLAMVPPADVEVARVDFWNSSIKAHYGHATITSDALTPTTKVDIYCEFGTDTITTPQDVDYTAGETNTFESGFPSDTSSAIIKLPTETADGSINITINCTAFQLETVAISIGEFVRNPLAAGDYVFNANGKTATVKILPKKVYLKRYANAAWYIDTDGDLTPDWQFYFAFNTADKPVVGDINRDKTEDIAFFHEGAWYVNTTPSGVLPVLIDLQFWYGWPGDTPLVGDINQDGDDDIAVFHEGAWYVDLTGDRIVDEHFWYGFPGDTPLVGDINQDGDDDIAYFHEGAWYVDTNGPPYAPDLSFWYGFPGDTPVVGDFDHEGFDDIARFAGGAWYIDTNFDRTPDISVWYGYPGDTPVGGGELG